MMKKFLLPALILITIGLVAHFSKKDEAPSPTAQGSVEERAVEAAAEMQPGDEAIEKAFGSRSSGIQVEGAGEVLKVLKDDIKGSRHQRFIVRLTSGRTILIAHNIDLAPRVASLKAGAAVSFSGVYEWNSNGGTVHWTHHDPDGRHRAGWIRHDGRMYQ